MQANRSDQIFAKRHAGASGYHDEVFHDDEHLLRTLTKVLDDASSSHRKLAEGLQDAQLENGSRLHIVHNDIGRDGHVLVNIRKFSGIQIRRLDELVERDMLDGRVARFVQAAIKARLSIVFAGPPGSGKTTLLTCCAAEFDPSLRIVVAEEVFETDVPLPNVQEGICGGRLPCRRRQGSSMATWRCLSLAVARPLLSTVRACADPRVLHSASCDSSTSTRPATSAAVSRPITDTLHTPSCAEHQG